MAGRLEITFSFQFTFCSLSVRISLSVHFRYITLALTGLTSPSSHLSLKGQLTVFCKAQLLVTIAYTVYAILVLPFWPAQRL